MSCSGPDRVRLTASDSARVMRCCEWVGSRMTNVLSLSAGPRVSFHAAIIEPQSTVVLRADQPVLVRREQESLPRAYVSHGKVARATGFQIDSSHRRKRC